MKLASIFFLVLFALSTFAQAKEGFVVTTKELSGIDTINEIMSSERDWLSFSFGEGHSGRQCHSYIMISNEKNFLEVVITDKNQNPKIRFYVSEKQAYTLVREESDGSDGENVGFYTYDTYKIDQHTLRFEKAGDMYYEVIIKSNDEQYTCSVGF